MLKVNRKHLTDNVQDNIRLISLPVGRRHRYPVKGRKRRLLVPRIDNTWKAAMAETAPVVHIGENSPELIAYKLLVTIAANEKKSLHASAGGQATADRKWLLDTYAECLLTVRDPVSRRVVTTIKPLSL